MNSFVLRHAKSVIGMTRKLRLLRAHGLIQKVPRTHRHLVSSKGRQLIAVLHAAREADIQKMNKAA